MLRGDLLGSAAAAALLVACGSSVSTPGFESLAGGSGGAPSTSSGTSTASSTSATTTSATSTSGSGGSGGFQGPIGDDRPVKVIVPPDYDPAIASPLVILLHGYSASGDLQELYLDLGKEASARGYLFAHPDGTSDSTGLQYWNATDACCNLFNKNIDDSSYLALVIDQIEQAYHVDAKRVFFVGHSNGGFMSHRMACDHADKIAAIATLAGSTWKDQSKCNPSAPMNVLVVHGTLDPVILYGGGNLFGNDYPGAVETAKDWAAKDGCAPAPNQNLPSMDLVGLPTHETTVSRWSGCAQGRVVEHWRIEGSGHVPLFNGNFKAALFDFLDAHPKP